MYIYWNSRWFKDGDCTETTEDLLEEIDRGIEKIIDKLKDREEDDDEDTISRN